jgi:hypothetical protein
MQLFFAGGESQAHIDTLRSCGVSRVAVSISNLARHTSDYAAWAGKGHLKGLDWFVYADSPTVPVQPLLELLSGSQGEPDGVAGPVDWATETWLNDSDILFLPTWDGHDASILRGYVELYDGTVLPDAVVDNPAAVRTAKACMGRMSTLGALTGRSKGIDKFDLLVSSAWYAVQKHGETQVWSGNRLVRMNSDDKHMKRQRYASAIEALGVDVGAVLADDPKETARLAILSWLAMESYINAGKRLESSDRLPAVVTNGHVSTSNGSVPDLSGVASAPLATRHGSTVALPLVSLSSVSHQTTDEQGNPITTTYNLIESSQESVRQCDTCSLSAACPGYQQQAACSYNIPVVVRTKDQRQAVLRTLVEIQTQRILMGSFAEQVQGERDDQVGKEMDRLFNMVEKWKNIEEQTTKLHIGIEASGPDADGNLGMISALFGSQAGQNARMLDVPMLSEELIEEAELVPEDAQ